MLQQTRIEAVLPYFERFMAAFPTVKELAQASEDRVLKLWEGLGYYSRARNLQKAARILMERGGALPASYEELLALPGIGEYTAGAVASIAFGLPVPAVDGNVMRVLARLLAIDTDVLRPAAKKAFTAIAREMIPRDQPGAFNQAVMELGETLCLPNTQPKCGECPLRNVCKAHSLGRERDYPVRSPKKARTVEERTVLVLLTMLGGERCTSDPAPGCWRACGSCPTWRGGCPRKRRRRRRGFGGSGRSKFLSCRKESIFLPISNGGWAVTGWRGRLDGRRRTAVGSPPRSWRKPARCPRPFESIPGCFPFCCGKKADKQERGSD